MGSATKSSEIRHEHIWDVIDGPSPFDPMNDNSSPLSKGRVKFVPSTRGASEAKPLAGSSRGR